MTTCELLLARPATAWIRYAALDRWIKFCDPARAEQRLCGNPLAWLAISKVTEVRAFMFAAWQHLLALDGAKMESSRIASSASKLFLDWTADFFALMLVARFQVFAHYLAFELTERLDFSV